MKSDLAKVHHARSVKEFPEIDLEEGEFVALHVVRSKIGLILIWVGEVVGFGALTVALSLFLIAGDSIFELNDVARGYLFMIIFVLYGVLILSGVIGTVIYRSNHLYITNKRAIQKSRPSLFANSTNIIELKSIEDVSFRQDGILDYILRMGTIRMATMGDETTYTFPYVDTPRDEIRVITHLVHETKK
jgi:hypothetical protein